MPKQVPRIPDALLHDPKLWSLHHGTLLTTGQVAVLVGMSVDQLKDRRRTKPPQPPAPLEPDDPGKRGGAVWYALGTVLAYLRERIPTPLDSQGRAFPTFASFLTSALPEDEWLFARAATGQLIDFGASLRLGEEMDPEAECVWLTFEAYLSEGARWVGAQRSELSRREMEAKVAFPDEAPERCPRCGGAHHPDALCERL